MGVLLAYAFMAGVVGALITVNAVEKESFPLLLAATVGVLAGSVWPMTLAAALVARFV